MIVIGNADRADDAFGQNRYFPGRGQELFVELQFRANGRKLDLTFVG
jgi:hypothetical protein